MTKKRPAHRPPLYGERMRRVNVSLDAQTVDWLTELGKGNLSAGIRAAAAFTGGFSAEKPKSS